MYPDDEEPVKAMVRTSLPKYLVKRISILAKSWGGTKSEVVREMIQFGHDNFKDTLGGKTQPIYVRLNDDDFARLEKRAQKEHMSKSRLVRAYIEEYFKLGDVEDDDF